MFKRDPLGPRPRYRSRDDTLTRSSAPPCRPMPPGSLSVNPRLTAVIVVGIALTITLAAVPNWPVGVFQDDGIYVVLGKALASGEGYRYINLPGAPYATHYPPGYPLLLALLWKLAPAFPQNVAVFTFTNAGFLSLAAYATFRFARERLGLGTLGAGMVAVVGTASVPALSFGVFVLSEPMFLALLLPALILAERAADRGDWRDALMAGLAGGALAMVRTMGVFVVPALVLVLLTRRRWLPAIVSTAAWAAFVVPWSRWVAAHGSEIPLALVGKYGPYDSWLTNAVRAHGLRFVWEVVSRNAGALYGMSAEMFTGGVASLAALRPAAALGAGLLLAAGGWRLARRAPVAAWFVVAYLALVIIWPFDPTRFVWGLLPILSAMLALGIAGVVERKPTTALQAHARLAALGGCALLVAGFATYNRTGALLQWRDAVPRATAARATPVVQWLRASTRPSDVIAVEDDVLIYLYTGRRAVPVGTLTAEQYLHDQSYAFATEQLQRIIARYRPTYVIGTTSYGVISARNLSMLTPPQLRVHMLLPTAAIFTPVAP
jgi:hypothetical protein